MKYILCILLFGSFLLNANIVSANAKDCEEKKRFRPAFDDRVKIATGLLDGIYFPLGISICEFANSKFADENYRCAAIPTDGSKDNLYLLNCGEVDYAIVQDDVLAKYDSHDTLEEIALHYEYFHFLINGHSDLQQLSELVGKQVYAGKENSGHYTVAKRVFSQLNLPEPEFQIKDSRYSLGERLCGNVPEEDGLDAILLTIGPKAEVLNRIDDDCDCIGTPHIPDNLQKQNSYFELAELPTRFDNSCADPVNQTMTKVKKAMSFKMRAQRAITFKMKANLVRLKTSSRNNWLWNAITESRSNFNEYVSPFGDLVEAN